MIWDNNNQFQLINRLSFISNDVKECRVIAIDNKMAPNPESIQFHQMIHRDVKLVKRASLLSNDLIKQGQPADFSIHKLCCQWISALLDQKKLENLGPTWTKLPMDF